VAAQIHARLGDLVPAFWDEVGMDRRRSFAGIYRCRKRSRPEGGTGVLAGRWGGRGAFAAVRSVEDMMAAVAEQPSNHSPF
jgi:hypothetical protein